MEKALIRLLKANSDDKKIEDPGKTQNFNLGLIDNDNLLSRNR